MRWHHVPSEDWWDCECGNAYDRKRDWWVFCSDTVSFVDVGRRNLPRPTVSVTNAERLEGGDDEAMPGRDEPFESYARKVHVHQMLEPSTLGL